MFYFLGVVQDCCDLCQNLRWPSLSIFLSKCKKCFWQKRCDVHSSTIYSSPFWNWESTGGAETLWKCYPPVIWAKPRNCLFNALFTAFSTNLAVFLMDLFSKILSHICFQRYFLTDVSQNVSEDPECTFLFLSTLLKRGLHTKEKLIAMLNLAIAGGEGNNF